MTRKQLDRGRSWPSARRGLGRLGVARAERAAARGRAGERVQRAAAELGYVPDAVARSLKVGRTQQIALAVADVGNPVYVTMMRAVEGSSPRPATGWW